MDVIWKDRDPEKNERFNNQTSTVNPELWHTGSMNAAFVALWPGREKSISFFDWMKQYHVQITCCETCKGKSCEGLKCSDRHYWGFKKKKVLLHLWLNIKDEWKPKQPHFNEYVYWLIGHPTLAIMALVRTAIPTKTATRYWASSKHLCFFSFSAPTGFSWNGSHVSLGHTQWCI